MLLAEKLVQLFFDSRNKSGACPTWELLFTKAVCSCFIELRYRRNLFDWSFLAMLYMACCYQFTLYNLAKLLFFNVYTFLYVFRRPFIDSKIIGNILYDMG